MSGPPLWVILYWSARSSGEPMFLLSEHDVDAEQDWNVDHQPEDYAAWNTDEEATTWAEENMDRVHPNCYWLTFDYGSRPLYTSGEPA